MLAIHCPKKLERGRGLAVTWLAMALLSATVNREWGAKICRPKMPEAAKHINCLLQTSVEKFNQVMAQIVPLLVGWDFWPKYSWFFIYSRDCCVNVEVPWGGKAIWD